MVSICAVSCRSASTSVTGTDGKEYQIYAIPDSVATDVQIALKEELTEAIWKYTDAVEGKFQLKLAESKKDILEDGVSPECYDFLKAYLKKTNKEYKKFLDDNPDLAEYALENLSRDLNSAKQEFLEKKKAE